MLSRSLQLENSEVLLSMFTLHPQYSPHPQLYPLSCILLILNEFLYCVSLLRQKLCLTYLSVHSPPQHPVHCFLHTWTIVFKQSIKIHISPAIDLQFVLICHFSKWITSQMEFFISQNEPFYHLPYLWVWHQWPKESPSLPDWILRRVSDESKMYMAVHQGWTAQ